MRTAIVSGIASALAMCAIRNAVQTDAPINPGNSGGPLLDARGRLIGVISQARGAGIAFAVPADTVRRVVARLGRANRP